MRKFFCDKCNTTIKENKYYNLVWEERLQKDDEDKESDWHNFDFCSERCMGKWMMEKAKQFGVYE